MPSFRAACAHRRESSRPGPVGIASVRATLKPGSARASPSRECFAIQTGRARLRPSRKLPRLAGKLAHPESSNGIKGAHHGSPDHTRVARKRKSGNNIVDAIAVIPD